MLGIVGTVPDTDFPLTYGEVEIKGEDMFLKGRKIPVNRGTPALIAAAVHIAKALALPYPRAYLIGDIGLGDGSRELYSWLSQNLGHVEQENLVFHYLQPDVDWQFRILEAVDKMSNRPTLIADAGFMYAAKMSTLAPEYDLFTPDIGELAFLADEKAPHPFYTRGFILHGDQKAKNLAKLAYEHNNAAKHLLVKGESDLVINNEGIMHQVESPCSENMEAIGGTGDTLTGTVSSLIAWGMPIDEASRKASLINRWAGKLISPTPATQIGEIAFNLQKACDKVLN